MYKQFNSVPAFINEIATIANSENGKNETGESMDDIRYLFKLFLFKQAGVYGELSNGVFFACQRQCNAIVSNEIANLFLALASQIVAYEATNGSFDSEVNVVINSEYNSFTVI